ncbi:hypothetical protein [Nostoc sp. CALU 546]|uniref:hypothetical protein n=1 Tax=Nostoc sp. CALU 546 TaxID=1867241 RepID=UPI003B66F0AE
MDLYWSDICDRLWLKHLYRRPRLISALVTTAPPQPTIATSGGNACPAFDNNLLSKYDYFPTWRKIVVAFDPTK